MPDAATEPVVLETRNVFIDTSAFEALSFGFTRGVLKILAGTDNINIYLTAVTEREVRARLGKAASESVHAHKSFGDKSRVLRTLADKAYGALFKKFTAEEVAAHLCRMFDNFLDEASVTVLPVSAVSVDGILDRYFGVEPPFAEGKKKSEFPDAIALEAISQWAAEHDERMYVVAIDGDMKGYCEKDERLIYVESVEKFLDRVVAEDEASATHVRELIGNNADAIEERIAQDFPSMGFYIDDREGDVEVFVKGVAIDDSAIVRIAKHVATVRVEVTIDFDAHVSYDDLEHAPYDSETKSLIVLDQVSETWERSFEGSCTLMVSFSPDAPQQFGIEAISINEHQDIELVFDDEWPYK